MKKRLGKFDISDNIIDTPEFIEVLKHLEFVPYQVKHFVNSRSFKYLGTSIAFNLIEVGSRIPTYNITIHNKYNKNTDSTAIEKVSAERC